MSKTTKTTSYPKEKIKILFLENISQKAADRFVENEYVNVERAGGALSEAELIKKISDD